MTGTERVRRAFADRSTAGGPLADDANFFEAGLTSLRLAEVVDDLRSAGVDIVLVDVFRYPTLRELTDELARRDGDRHASGRPPLPWQAERARPAK